ncbi:MAG: hypothetical protein KatS3mg124_1851 [Porticoccaceae bacterium]|nr:MAG: hypothetical protein KatS3mg124_1851 [Porticoccaceae bacterium]
MLDPRSKEFEDRFRARYEALAPGIAGKRELGGRNWIDRVASWDDFVAYGANAAACLRPWPDDPWFPGGHLDNRALYPELADLVLEAFPESS